jgi:hypothetical protein
MRARAVILFEPIGTNVGNVLAGGKQQKARKEWQSRWSPSPTAELTYLGFREGPVTIRFLAWAVSPEIYG